MQRYEIAPEQWELIRLMFPRKSGPGHPWRDHRPLLNAILWVLHTGAPWRDVPSEYGPWETAYYRFNRWRREGLWDVVARRLQLRLRHDGYVDWDQGSIDGTSVRASKAAAGALKKGAPRRSLRTTRWGGPAEAGARRSTSSRRPKASR
jgi:transposase